MNWTKGYIQYEDGTVEASQIVTDCLKNCAVDKNFQFQISCI